MPVAHAARAGQRHARRRGRWLGALAVVAVIASAAVALVLTWRINEVRIVGADDVSADEIVKSAALSGDERMLLTRFANVANRVEAIPAIASASVRRGLWAAVVITVIERRAVAVLKGRPHLAVDERGVVFEAPDDGGIPVLSGWRGQAEPGSRVDAATRVVLAAMPDFPASLRERTVEVSVGKVLTLAIRGGAKVRFGEPSDLARKAAAADTVLADAGRRGLSLAYVDVRRASVPVAREWKAAEPSPVPTPDPQVRD